MKKATMEKQMTKGTPFSYAYDDYIQSANMLFHCMKEGRFLESILEKRAIVPRYCIENMKYLNIRRLNSEDMAKRLSH